MVAIVMIGVPGVSVAAFDRSHALFDALLHSHVINGRVDYRRLVADPGPLRAYLDSLGAVTAAELATWPHEDQLAFWINAYNAFVLMSVVEYYPLSRHTLVGLAFPANSIWQVPDVWKAARWRAASRTVSLDMIEHEIIRPIFRERRTHFALVCAASSCPNLRSEAYRGDRLDEQLEDQTRRFLADANKGLRLDRGNGKVLLSKIFEWYAADFGQAGGSSAGHSAAERGVVEFVSTHTVDPGVREFLQDPTIRIGYLPYDWTLNDQAPLAGARQ
ncbi:MAG: DUF547 domain-containing protein [Steroidobacteraceae bacterium]